MEDGTELLLSGGESPRNVGAYLRYRLDAQRGKTLLQLKAVAEDISPEIRRQWSPRSFTAILTDEGEFDAVVCNIAYHFHKHGQAFGNIQRMTEEAVRVYSEQRQAGVVRATDGLLEIKDGGLYELDGRIVTYYGKCR